MARGLDALAYRDRAKALRASAFAYAYADPRRTRTFGFNPDQLRWPKGSPNGWGGRWMDAPWKIGQSLLDWADQWPNGSPAGWRKVTSAVAAMKDAGVDTTGEALWRQINDAQQGIREAQATPGLDPATFERMTEADLALGRWADQGPEALDMVLENARWLRDTTEAPETPAAALKPQEPSRLDLADLDFSWLDGPIDDYDLGWLMEGVETPGGKVYPGSAADGIDGGRFSPARQQEYRTIGEAVVGQTYDARRGGTPEAPLLERKATILGGGAGSGKSSLLKQPDLADARTGAALIGGDEVRVNLSSYNRIHDSAPTEAAGVAHAESMVVADRLLEMAQKAGVKFVADQTSSGDVRVLRHQINELHDAGYEVAGAFAFADPHEAWVRSLIRGIKKGRFIPYQALLRSHRGAATNFNELLDAYDTANVFDTSGAAPKLVATKPKGGDLQVLDEDGWQRFQLGGESATERAMTRADFMRIARLAVADGYPIPPAIYAMAIDSGINLPALIEQVKNEQGVNNAS